MIASELQSPTLVGKQKHGLTTLLDSQLKMLIKKMQKGYNEQTIRATFILKREDGCYIE